MPNQKKESETAMRSKSTQWSHLPVELCQEIMGRLYVPDQVRFRAVCKNWQFSQYKTRPGDSLPWLIKLPRISKNIYECQLYEPLSESTYLVDKIMFDKASPDIGVSYKDGCLLFSISGPDSTSTYFFLFSILTTKVTALPVLYHPKGSDCDFHKSFSVDPDSSDFVFLVTRFKHGYTPTTYTLHYGKKYWTTRNINEKLFSCVDNTAVYIRGIFYFVSLVGEVNAYNIATGSQMTLSSHDNILRGLERGMPLISKVLQLDEDLVLVWYNAHFDGPGLCGIRRFDLTKKVWLPVKSLRDRALFVGPNSFSVSTLGEDARSHGVLANQIYCLTCCGCNVHTLKDGEMVKFMNGSDIKNCDTNATYKEFWFEPPDHLLKHKQTW